MKSNNDKKWTIVDVLTNFSKTQSQVQQEKQLKQQLKDALMQNQAQALGQFVPGMEQQMQPMQQDMSLEQSYEQAKHGGIHIDPSKKGTFKTQATRMRMGIQEAAEYILSNKDEYTSGMVRKANFARNFAKEEGGEMMRYGAGGDMMACSEGLYWDGQKCVEIPKQISDRNMQTYFTNPPSYGVTDNSGNSLYDGSDVERAKGFYARGSEYAIIPPEGTPRPILPNPVDMLRQLNEQNSDVLRNAALRKKQLSEIEVNENWNRLSNKIEKENDGGEMLNEYGRGGYTVRRSNDRKGKTHVVTGPDGTKKYFGDPNMGERGDSKYGKDAFYARHADSLRKNPYFRAYAKSTWEEGGEMDDPCPPDQYWDEDLGQCVPFNAGLPNREQLYNDPSMMDFMNKMNYRRNNNEQEFYKKQQIKKYLDENYTGPRIQEGPKQGQIDKEAPEWDEFWNSEDYQNFNRSVGDDYRQKEYYPREGDWDEKSKMLYNELFNPNASEYEKRQHQLRQHYEEHPEIPIKMQDLQNQDKWGESYDLEDQIIKELPNQNYKNPSPSDLRQDRYDNWCPCTKMKEVIYAGVPVMEEVCVPCEQAEYGGQMQEYYNGGMIKRADGSYSKRGLWDNIRANAGSGKKPTKEMLEQERKLRKFS